MNIKSNPEENEIKWRRDRSEEAEWKTLGDVVDDATVEKDLRRLTTADFLDKYRVRDAGDTATYVPSAMVYDLPFASEHEVKELSESEDMKLVLDRIRRGDPLPMSMFSRESLDLYGRAFDYIVKVVGSEFGIGEESGADAEPSSGVDEVEPPQDNDSGDDDEWTELARELTKRAKWPRNEN